MTCQRVALTAVAAAAVFASSMMAQPKFSDWSAPVNLGPVVNSAFADQAPAVSKDGLSLYFSSDRPGFGANDLWVSQRNSVEDSWGAPVNLGVVINTPAFEARPSLSRDGHWLFFNSTRPGGFAPGQDIWASYREHVHDDFGWQPPINLGPGVNAAGSSEIEPSFVENGHGGALLFFASNRPGGPGPFDIYVSELQPDGTWGAATLVADLSSALQEPQLTVRFDGLEAFFARGVPPNAFDLWVSTRESVFLPWSPPVNLGSAVNSIGSDESPDIGSDRRTLYFASNRPGGSGGTDLYVTERARANRDKAPGAQ